MMKATRPQKAVVPSADFVDDRSHSQKADRFLGECVLQSDGNLLPLSTGKAVCSELFAEALISKSQEERRCAQVYFRQVQGSHRSTRHADLAILRDAQLLGISPESPIFPSQESSVLQSRKQGAEHSDSSLEEWLQGRLQPRPSLVPQRKSVGKMLKLAPSVSLTEKGTKEDSFSKDVSEANKKNGKEAA